MTAITPDLLNEWQSAIGRTEQRHEVVEAESIRRYAIAIGADPAVEAALPPLAHWALFLPQPSDAELGSDGHPKRGGFLPAITLPRRMFAASDIEFHAPLILGEVAQQDSRIIDVRHKSGKSGDLIFVEVERLIQQHGSVRLRERQSYVYRDFGPPAPMPEAISPAPEGQLWQLNATHLFRFSAVTFNSHRIHYDLPYAQGEEGYPALVVHGPFTAAKLAAHAMQHAALKRFQFRAEAPLFLGQPIYLTQSGDTLQAIRADGQTAMRATVTY